MGTTITITAEGRRNALLKIPRSLCFAILVTSVSARAATTNEHAHFGFLAMNEISLSAITNMACNTYSCKGLVAGRWVQADINAKGISFIKVIYNEKTIDGKWIEGPPLTLKEAIRENSFENSRTRPAFGRMTNDRGQTVCWVDKVNHIVYEQNPEDEQRGITVVNYVEGDAPILKRAKETADLEKAIVDIWHSLLDEPKTETKH